MRRAAIYTPELVKDIMWMREQCKMQPKEIAEELTVRLGQPIHRRTISEIADNFIGETPPIKAPIFDGWCFVHENVEVDRFDREVHG